MYTPILLAIFRKKYTPGAARIVFTLEEVRQELRAAGLEARNTADLIYRMKSRTVLPAEIQEAGFRILEITSRGVYALVVGDSTLIDYPEVESVIEVHDRTPLPVRRLLDEDFGSTDEQGLLSVVRYNDLLTHFLGAPAFHLKSHVRKSVPGVGLAEVDDVHVCMVAGEDPTGPLAVVPVEAKAKDDPVDRVQIAMQVRYAIHAFPGLQVRPLTIKLFEDGLVLFMEFDPTTEPNELAVLRYAYYRIVRRALPTSLARPEQPLPE